ncbi:MAG: hypothetical protein R8J41_03600 [Alphaproteobacteria bacterium]|nr:hypothetical protein [Alphaproteobacteria bacterium]
MINCTKDGYEQATFHNNSGLSSAVGANIAVDVLLTAGLSSIIDSANGADNEYQEVVNITLRRRTDAPAPLAATTPAPENAAAETAAEPAGGMTPIANP